jgi:pSer/pThr/pTyr-binding forkhead associated (FHA) protein
MKLNSDADIRRVTTELSEEILREKLNTRTEMIFRSVPFAQSDADTQPVWRIRLELTHDSQVRIGLDVNGEVMLGRGHDGDDYVDLSQYTDAEQFGVSRSHAMLRPTDTKLYIVDLDSTNGTWLNNHSIGVNTPYSLSNGDLLRVGRLEFMVRILRQPDQSAAAHRQKADAGEALPSIARAIHSQLEVGQVLHQAMEMAMRFVPADEITFWLVDEPTGELFLEAGRGTSETQIQRLPVADTLAGKVIQTGKPMRANRQQDEGQIKLKTGYLVEAVIYVPLSLGGVPFGVMSVVHRRANCSAPRMRRCWRTSRIWRRWRCTTPGCIRRPSGR